MTTKRFIPEFVESFPTPLSAGVFYVSLEYRTCAHLCACGCGNEAVTPLSPAQWSFTYDGDSISVRPSVGNWALECQSHYVIEKGLVRWARAFSQDEIAGNRARDRAAFEHPEPGFGAPVTSHPENPNSSTAGGLRPRDLATRAFNWLRKRS